MKKQEAIAKLDTLANLFKFNICELDVIVSALPPSEAFLIDRLCSIIGGALAVHSDLKTAIRACTEPISEQYVTNMEMYERSLSKNVVRFDKGGDIPPCA